MGNSQYAGSSTASRSTDAASSARLHSPAHSRSGSQPRDGFSQGSWVGFDHRPIKDLLEAWKDGTLPQSYSHWLTNNEGDYGHGDQAIRGSTIAEWYRSCKDDEEIKDFGAVSLGTLVRHCIARAAGKVKVSDRPSPPSRFYAHLLNRQQQQLHRAPSPYMPGRMDSTDRSRDRKAAAPVMASGPAQGPLPGTASTEKGKGRAGSRELTSDIAYKGPPAETEIKESHHKPIGKILDLIVKGELPPRLKRWESDEYNIYGEGQWALKPSEMIKWYRKATEVQKSTFCSIKAMNVASTMLKIASSGPTGKYRSSTVLEWYKEIRGIKPPDFGSFPFHAARCVTAGEPRKQSMIYVLHLYQLGGWNAQPYVALAQGQEGPFPMKIYAKMYELDQERLIAVFGVMTYRNVCQTFKGYHIGNGNPETQGDSSATGAWQEAYFDLKVLQDNFNNVTTLADLSRLRTNTQSESSQRGRSPPSRKHGSPSAT